VSNNLRKGVLSSALLVVDSLAKKLVGLASTLVLARLLLPEDFGIIAIATLMIGFVEILSNTGSSQYLLRVDNLDSDKVNTAWTINFIIKTVLSILMLVGSYFISEYYDDPRLINVLWSLTLVFFIHGFQNPGISFLKRSQNYTQLVKLSVVVKIVSAAAAVTVAIMLESYWALVIGKLTNAVLMVIGTHSICSHKIKFMLKNAKDQWQFSGWMIPQAIFGYFRTQLDTLIVSSTFGASGLGFYHTMKYVAFIPSAHLIGPISEPFLVELTNAKGSATYFAKQFKASFLILLMVGLPISTLMYFNHSNITAVLLGENWLEYSYLLGVFGLLLPSFIMAHQARRVLLVYGKTKQIFYYEIIAFLAIYGVVIASGVREIKEFSTLLVVMENIVSFLFVVFILLRYTGVKSTLKMFVAVIPLLYSIAISNYISKQIVSTELSAFFELVAVSAMFVINFIASMITSYYLGFKNLTEYQYLESLVARSLNPIISKLKLTRK
jgi:O-antigen/teichoic acid export membrane protein